ncbi:hypothetical protein H4F17_18690 [Vibrio cholerae]
MEQSELDLEVWERAVGKIVSSVARLEGELLLKYETHDALSRSMYFKVDKTLEKRFERVKSLYNAECGITSCSDKLFTQFQGLVELRNLVAHNPVYYEDADKGFRITNGQSKTKYISLNDILKLAENVFSACLQITILFRVWAKNKS